MATVEHNIATVEHKIVTVEDKVPTVEHKIATVEPCFAQCSGKLHLALKVAACLKIANLRIESNLLLLSREVVYSADY